MHPHDKFFKIFLLIYAGFLVFHALQMVWTPLAILGALVGLALAIVAHLRHSYATVILLVVHMGIEWIEYAQSGFGYSNREMAFYIVHVLLDAVFFWQEAKSHLFRFRYLASAGVVIGLLALSAWFYIPVSNIEISEKENAVPVEAAVIGGILGCTFSHLLSKRKHEHS
jgi:hypothetical protein